MRAAFIHGIRDVRIGELPDPVVPSDEVLLDVAAVGICGSDLHYYLEGAIGAATIRQPFVPGHEFSCRVAEDRPDLNLKKGQLVAVDPARPCGHCEWCHASYPNLCPNVQFTGAPPFHGALTQRLTAYPYQIFSLPEWFSPEQAVMLETLGIAVHAMDLAKVQLLETAAILGCGPVGLSILQLVKLAGASRVYAIDPVEHRAKVAKELGATEIGDKHTAIADWTKGRGVDLVIEATNSPVGFQQAAEAVRIGGRLVVVGIPEGDRYSLEASLMRRKGLSIKLSRRMGHVYPRSIQLVAEGKVNVDRLVSHRFPLAKTKEAFDLQAEYADAAMKSMIFPNQ
ncbi:MAG TPA: zinc-binding dehydrogenase [Terriglobia bacterium]|nr:zinc-binding dehydrogenase [Terriglobia bacterium]